MVTRLHPPISAPARIHAKRAIIVPPKSFAMIALQRKSPAQRPGLPRAISEQAELLLDPARAAAAGAWRATARAGSSGPAIVHRLLRAAGMAATCACAG